MPSHIQIPKLRAIFPLGCRNLVGRAWVLCQTLLDQLHQRLCKALSVPQHLKYESDGGPGLADLILLARLLLLNAGSA